MPMTQACLEMHLMHESKSGNLPEAKLPHPDFHVFFFSSFISSKMKGFEECLLF